jgi:Pyruvate/2-oxoacid:ferredoxin oxidoreductase gamma subunit/GNAT superfamily N-acetyltransferase
MTTIMRLQEENADKVSELFAVVVDGLLPDADAKTRESYKAKYSAERLKRLLDDKDNTLIVATEQGKVVGFIFGWVFHGIGNIHWIGVEPALRGKGIAKQLTEAAIEEFKSKDCYKAELFTYTGDKSAEGFFTKFGFNKMSKIDENFCRMEVLRMELNLRKPKEEEKAVRIIISGSAGQGIKLCGTILASILAKLDKHVTLNIVYGPSVRGGKMHAELTYSDEQIANPFIDKADILVMLSKEGDAFPAKKTISNLGVTEGEQVPFSDLAKDRFGSHVFVNMLALGKLLRSVGANIEKINLENNLPKRFIEKNIEAINFGYNYRDGI